jgi:hypothetical protein
MAYENFRLPKAVPKELRSFVRKHIDPRFAEFEFLLLQHMPNSGPKGTLHHPLSVILLSLCDGCAQLLVTDKLSNKQLFVKFLLDFYPWDKDEPEGRSRRASCEALWQLFRNPLTHTFGLRAQGAPRTKIGRSLAPLDLAYLNSGDGERPMEKHFLDGDIGRTVFWIESFYWGLRRAVEASFADSTRWALIECHIGRGNFDR